MIRIIISYLGIIFLCNNSSNCYGIEGGLNKNEDFIMLSQKSFSEGEILQIDSIPCKINIFKLNKFNEPAFSNLESDTISFNISKVSNKNIVAGDEFIEIRWKVYVDSSFQNEMIGIEFNRFDYTKVFWDDKSIVEQGILNDLKHIFEPNKLTINAYPLNTQIAGWHDLIIRQKHKGNIFKAGVLSRPLFFKLHKNYNKIIEDDNVRENSIDNIFFVEGFRFFLLSIFLTSFLFFLLVKKSKSIFWFSVFAFFTSIGYFAPNGLLFNNSDQYVYCIFPIILINFYSLISFIFYTFFEKLPTRINWYFFIILIVGLMLFFIRVYPNSYFKYFEPFNNFFMFLGIGIYAIILLEGIVKIVYALILKKKRIKIIAFGLIFYLIGSILFYGLDFGGQILLIFSVYIIPISFLITLIYLIKDSFAENITKKEEILQLTLANESILKEQNIILDKKVIERTTEVVEQKKKLEEQKQEITDSIQYAQRIQFAILPTKENIAKAFPQSFILFKPKDIVSGDFYWFQEVDGKKYIAACDCTGHGVPGALMSMVATDMLNDALVHTKKVDEILAHTNRSIRVALKQSSDDDSTRDGMDIALCCYNDKTNVLQFAGAYRPLWLIRFSHAEQSEASKNAYELLEFKATKAAIGGLTEDNQTFQLNEIQLQKGDTIYLASDGFADQFSPADKKLMTKRFKEILLSIQQLSMTEQGNYLDKFITDWRGNMEQTDDVLVIGVRV